MATIIVKNNGVVDVDLPDLGLSIAAAAQRTLSAEFTLDELDQSSDLYNAVNSGALVINDGTSDLSALDGLLHLRLMMDHEILQNHYTKAQLQTDGAAIVTWNNIINKPSFGSFDWQNASYCRVEKIGSAAPDGPTEGMFYVDTDDGHVYKYTSSAWVDKGIPARVINKTDQHLYDSTSTVWVDVGVGVNWATVVFDDGDGKQAQYVYSGSTWVKIADVDWGDHGSLTGLGDDDHTQYLNNTRGDARYYRQNQFINASTGPSDAAKPIITDATGKISLSFLDLGGVSSNISHSNLQGLANDDHTQYLNNTRHDTTTRHTLGSVVPHDTLDGVYDSGGAGTGRSITVDSGPVVLAASGGYAPLQLTQLSSDPNTGLLDGQVMVKGGRMYLYDATRSKWLTVEKYAFQFGRGAANQNSQWLRHPDNTVSNLSGPRMLVNSTVIGLAVQTSANANAVFYLRKNGTATNLASLTLGGSVAGNQDTSINVNFDAGEFISVYMSVTSGNVSYPIFTVYVAFR